MKKIIILSLLFTFAIMAFAYLSGCSKDKDSGPGTSTPAGTAGGDLSGNYPAPIVAKLQGRAVSTTAPGDGQGLLWNNTSSQWEPRTLAGLGLWQSSGNNVYASLTGNLGIGTATPTDEIHVKKDINSFVGITIENTDPGSGSTERISFTDENGSIAYIQASDDGSIAGPAFTIANNRPNGYFTLNTGGTARMTVANNGNVGIGNTAPAQKLSVTGNICATGTIGACSDIRYKKNIMTMTDALMKILSLHAIYYNWDKKKISKEAYTPARQLGFSAQEIEKYFPEIVQTDGRGYKAVDYGRFTPILVEAIKEQQQNLMAQQQQIDELKRMVAVLVENRN
jgi:hypothetical protein